MQPAIDLPRIQRWMQAVIMAPGSNEAAVRSGVAQKEIPAEMAEAAVLPSGRLTSLERIGVYRGMYEARLRDALAVDYPILSGYLGDSLWEELTELYLEAHPSRSYTLNRLGDHLPNFISEVDGLPRAAFLQDLARFELALTEVFDAEQAPALSADDLWAISSETWESARLRPIPAFRLETYRYPVSTFTAAWRQDSDTRPPRRKDTYLAIFRRNYAPLILELRKPGYRILEALSSGKTLGEALRTTRASHDTLFQWFQQWVAEGLFQQVETGEPLLPHPKRLG